MNARILLKKAAYDLISEKPIENLNTKNILELAEVSKQTFYRYYKDKYDLANEIYKELVQDNIVSPSKINTIDDWETMYRKQFKVFRDNIDFIRHLYSSSETSCTVEYEIQETIKLDRELLKKRGADINDPRIMFAIQAKDVGGTYMMRDWILGGMQVSDDEMVERFKLIIPNVLVPFFF